MAKAFGGVTPAGATRPMARPAPAGVQPGQPRPTLRSRLSGFFPEQGSKQQYDMVMQLVQAGMANARDSGSPLASLLAPIAGAAIGSRASQKRQSAETTAQSEMLSSVLGDAANDPQVQKYASVLNDPDAPAYLKSIAQSRLDALTKPSGRSAPRRSTGGRTTSSGNPVDGQRNSRIYGEYDIGGVLYGRDSYGRMVPYAGPDGRPVSATRGGDTASAPGASPSITDEIIAMTVPPQTAAPAQPVAPALDKSDPLGILGIPPA